MGAILWRKFPFKTPSTGTVVSFSAAALQAVAQPIYLPTIEPSEADLARLKRHFPKADPASPPWASVKARLLAKNISPANLRDLQSTELLEMLGEFEPQQDRRIEETQDTRTLSREAEIVLDVLASNNGTSLRKGAVICHEIEGYVDLKSCVTSDGQMLVPKTEFKHRINTTLELSQPYFDKLRKRGSFLSFRARSNASRD